jgi:hypothetical protein
MPDDPTPSIQPADDVVEFGTVDGLERRPTRSALSVAARTPWRVLRALRTDRRVVPVVTGLAAVATFGSLVGEWQIIVVDGVDVPATLPPLTAGVAVLDAFGGAYLVGVFALAACTALALLGSPAVRRHARLTGLALSGALGALLVAVSMQLDRIGPAYGYRTIGWEVEPVVSAGRGLEAAFAGVGLAALALYLAGRIPGWTGTDQHAGAQPARGGAQPMPPGAYPVPPAGNDGRRPRGGTDQDEVPAPLDLSVGPAAPFAQLPEDRV